MNMTADALAQVANANPAQVWFFVCSSRARSATVIAAYISLDTAKRRARCVGGCSRVGRVVDGKAVTM